MGSWLACFFQAVSGQRLREEPSFPSGLKPSGSELSQVVSWITLTSLEWTSILWCFWRALRSPACQVASLHQVFWAFLPLHSLCFFPASHRCPPFQIELNPVPSWKSSPTSTTILIMYFIALCLQALIIHGHIVMILRAYFASPGR